MKNIGYIRASKSSIDTENQVSKIKEYARDNKIRVNLTIDIISSTKEVSKRKITEIINNLSSGDTIIVAELSRIARNTEETLAITRQVIAKNGKIISLNPMLTIGGDEISQKVMLVMLSLTSEIEGYFIRSRTRIALQEKKRLIKQDGFFINKRGEKCYSLGAKKGAYQKLKLEDKAKEVLKYKSLKLSNTAIAKLLSVSPITVARFLKHYPIKKGIYLKTPPSLAQEKKKILDNFDKP